MPPTRTTNCAPPADRRKSDPAVQDPSGEKLTRSADPNRTASALGGSPAGPRSVASTLMSTCGNAPISRAVETGSAPLPISARLIPFRLYPGTPHRPSAGGAIEDDRDVGRAGELRAGRGGTGADESRGVTDPARICNTGRDRRGQCGEEATIRAIGAQGRIASLRQTTLAAHALSRLRRRDREAATSGRTSPRCPGCSSGPRSS